MTFKEKSYCKIIKKSMDERFSEHVRCTRVDSSCGSTKYLRRRAAVISYKHL